MPASVNGKRNRKEGHHVASQSEENHDSHQEISVPPVRSHRYLLCIVSDAGIRILGMS